MEIIFLLLLDKNITKNGSIENLFKFLAYNKGQSYT